jgi:hypothetical protein
MWKNPKEKKPRNHNLGGGCGEKICALKVESSCQHLFRLALDTACCTNGMQHIVPHLQQIMVSTQSSGFIHQQA